MGWLKDTLTGSDNQTIAIGRILGVVIAGILLVAFPVTAVATVLAGTCDIDTWRQLFEALGIYVPLVVGAITALIWGTNPTEPKPVRKEGNDNV